MWVIRAGKNGMFYKNFIEMSRVYLSWEGYGFDLHEMKSMSDFRAIVSKEKNTDNRTSISNWAGQLYAFVKDISVGDYVLIPARDSKAYALATIAADYLYDANGKDQFYHYRTINILHTDIPRSIFSQTTAYSLNAFRTLFRVKNEDEVISAINKWKEASK